MDGEDLGEDVEMYGNGHGSGSGSGNVNVSMESEEEGEEDGQLTPRARRSLEIVG